MKFKEIFIAEPNPTDWNLFRQAIGRSGIGASLKVAEDGEQAMMMLYHGEYTPDYIFLNINLPRISGEECLNMIRRNFKLSNVPVIMFSSSTKGKKKGSESPADRYLTKPFNVDGLATELNELFNLPVAD